MKKKNKIYISNITALNYRLSIYKSCKNIYLQLINDDTKKTYIGLSSIPIINQNKKKFLTLKNLKISFLIGFYFSYLCSKKFFLQKMKKISLNKSFIGRIKYLIQGLQINSALTD